MNVKKLSLRPYFGTIHVCRSVADYKAVYREVFERDDEQFEKDGHERNGRTAFCVGDQDSTYVVYADDVPALAHELSHVVLDTFQACGIDPREAAGEPFCYMLAQLMTESLSGEGDAGESGK